jgi:hypothetical protein
MNFGPRFHEPARPLRKIAADELDGVDREDTDLILIVRMEVRSMVWRCRLGEHADDDPKESGDLWHPSLRSAEKAALSLAMTNDLSHTETLRFRLSPGQRVDLDTRGGIVLPSARIVEVPAVGAQHCW